MTTGIVDAVVAGAVETAKPAPEAPQSGPGQPTDALDQGQAAPEGQLPRTGGLEGMLAALTLLGGRHFAPAPGTALGEGSDTSGGLSSA